MLNDNYENILNEINLNDEIIEENIKRRRYELQEREHKYNEKKIKFNSLLKKAGLVSLIGSTIVVSLFGLNVISNMDLEILIANLNEKYHDLGYYFSKYKVGEETFGVNDNNNNEETFESEKDNNEKNTGLNISVGTASNIDDSIEFYNKYKNEIDYVGRICGIDPRILGAVCYRECAGDIYDKNGIAGIEYVNQGSTVTGINIVTGESISVTVTDRNNIEDGLLFLGIVLQNNLKKFNGNIYYGLYNYNYGDIFYYGLSNYCGDDFDAIVSNYSNLDVGYSLADDIHFNTYKYCNWNTERDGYYADNKYVENVLELYPINNSLQEKESIYSTYYCDGYFITIDLKTGDVKQKDNYYVPVNDEVKVSFR